MNTHFMTDLPKCPAVYALYGGRGSAKYVAYVGIADNLKARMTQHFVRRDSSVVTGASAVSLNPDLVTQVQWWTHDSFEERAVLEAAEIIAFGVHDPVLRSRGGKTSRAQNKLTDDGLSEKLTDFLRGQPSGELTLPSLDDVYMRLEGLEERVARLESGLRGHTKA